MKIDVPDTPRRVVLAAAAATLLGVGHTVQDVFGGSPALLAILSSVAMILQVVALSLLYSFSSWRRWPRWLLVAGLASICAGGGLAVIALHPVRHGGLPHTLTASLVAGTLICVFWLLVYLFPLLVEEARNRALKAESERRQAELTRLRANLHPHFLLNTLNAVSGLVVTEPETARRLVSLLGDLLRESLEDGPEMRTLEQEAAWLARYAEVFEIRYCGKVRFEWDLASDTTTLLLPRLLLQPLVENAIRHGALKKEGGGTVTLGAVRFPGSVRISVTDDGPGPGPDFREGLGLRLVRERLRLASPGASIVVQAGPTGGTVAALVLPEAEEPSR